MSSAQSFAEYATQNGYLIADPVEGEWTRCQAPGDTKHKKSATYRFFNDERPYATIHDKRTGEVIEWRGEIVKRDPEAAERMKKRQREREQERLNRQAAAALIAGKRWRNARPAKQHPYLVAKQVQPHGIRQEGRHLMIPMRASSGCIVSLQTIYSDGFKMYLEDGQRDGSVFLIGPRLSGYIGPVAVAEGFATAATVHEATGWPCFVTFDAGGMVAASEWMAVKWPDRKFIVAADDDWHLPLRDRPLPNTGRVKGTVAAKTLRAPIAFPTTGPDQTDFNDMARVHGMQAVRERLRGALA